MRRRLKRFEQVASFNNLSSFSSPVTASAPFSRGEEKMPPRFTLKGISIAVRVLGHEIRDFTQRKTGKDIAKLCKSGRPEIFDKLESIAKEVLVPTNLVDRLKSGHVHHKHLSVSLGSLVNSCSDEYFMYDDILMTNITKKLAIKESEGCMDLTASCESVPDSNSNLDLIDFSAIPCGCPGVRGIARRFAVFSSHNLLHYRDASVSLDSGLNILGKYDWSTFIKKDDWTVERKQISADGLYVYKISGKYDDISAYSFYKTQVDIDYRLKWDDYIIKLEKVEEPTDTSDVIHWVTKCPYPMKNREYVFERNFGVLPNEKAIAIVSKAIAHPSIPEKTDMVRVNSYGSQTVIRPYGEIDENGVEFTITYYDDPQSSLPSYCIDMIAKTGISGLMEQIHTAALDFQRTEESSRKKESMESK